MFRKAVGRLQTLNSIRIKPQFLWLHQQTCDGVDASKLVKGGVQIIRATEKYYNKNPWFDYVLYNSGRGEKIGQLRLLFKHPYVHGNAAPIRRLVRVEKETFKSVRVLEAQENQPGQTVDWEEETVILLCGFGCQYLKWELSEFEEYCSEIVRIQGIKRLVSIVSKFEAPLYLEKNGLAWNNKAWKMWERIWSGIERKKRGEVDW